MLIELLRYRALTAAGVPDGQPDPVTCSASVGCALRGCHRGTLAGQCIAIDDSSYQADRVVVVYVLWAVPATMVASRPWLVFIATVLDLEFTLIGGSAGLAADLLADTELETAVVDWLVDVSAGGDHVNYQ